MRQDLIVCGDETMTFVKYWLAKGEPFPPRMLIQTADTLILYCDKKRRFNPLEEKLRNGTLALTDFPDAASHIPITNLRSIKKIAEIGCIDLIDDMGNEVTFQADDQTSRTAKEIALSLGWSDPPVEEESTLGELSFGPKYTAIMVTLMGGLLTFAAAGLDPNDPGSPRAGRAGALRGIAMSLGPTGAALGTIAILAATGIFWLYKIKNPPRHLVFRPPANR